MEPGMRRSGTAPDASNDAPWSWPEFERVLNGAATRAANTLHVIGQPGGLLRLSGGRIVDAWTVGTPLAVPSPVAPAYRTAPRTSTPRISAPRISAPRKIVAIVDMLFAIAAGRIYGVREEFGSPGASSNGVELEHALREVNRRLAVLSSSGAWPTMCVESQPSQAFADRPPTALLTESERSVLGLAGAGTTVRDIAFLLGRGLYPVALDVVHLAEVGLVNIAMPPPPAAEPATTGSVPEPPELSGTPVSFGQRSGKAADPFARRRPRPTVPGPPAVDHPAPGRLVRRIPSASGINEPRRTQA